MIIFALTHSVCHAIKKDPVSYFWSVFDKGNVVAGLYAQDSEQLQFLSRWCVCEAFTIVKSFREAQGCGFMRLPAGVKVDLRVMYDTVSEF